MELNDKYKLMIYKIIGKITPPKNLYDDCIQVAYQSLYKNEPKWDKKRGAQSTFLWKCIFNDIIIFLRAEKSKWIGPQARVPATFVPIDDVTLYSTDNNTPSYLSNFLSKIQCKFNKKDTDLIVDYYCQSLDAKTLKKKYGNYQRRINKIKVELKDVFNELKEE